MSSNGMRTRRLAAALGSACFLGGVVMVASPADAGISLSLRPVTSSLPAGATVSGSNTAGWTLTLGASASQQTFAYDLVVQITSGTSTMPVAGQLGEIFGAVRGTAESGTVGSHVSGTAGVFSLDPNGTVAAVPNFVAGSFTTARRGVATTAAGGLGGVGPQTGTFFNAAGQPSFFHEFLVGSTTTTSPTPSFAGLPVPAAGVAIARASFNITAETVGSTAVLSFVGGDGANGTNGNTRWASWSDSVTGVPFFSTENFDAGLTSAIRNSLSIQIVNATPAFLKGDFNFDGEVLDSDISGFVSALTGDFASLIALFPARTEADFTFIGDFNGDSEVLDSDITGFVSALLGGGGRVGVIPEPAALSLLVPGMVLLRRRGR